MTPQVKMAAQETALRTRLGIPSAAQRVLVLRESSHWDSNWRATPHIVRQVDQLVDASRCDALERDIEPLPLIDGALRLRVTQSIESVRVELA